METIMDKLHSRTDICQKCRLAQTRTNVVFGEGFENADIMFIGEGPGEREDALGRPFVGRAGQLLDKMMAAIGLDRSNAYIANVVKCRPPGNRDPEPDEMEACIVYLREQVKLIHPRIMVLLGRIATKEILHEKAGITRLHGKVFYRNGFFIIPTYHPSALLRNQDLKRDAWSDLKTVKKVLTLVQTNEFSISDLHKFDEQIDTDGIFGR